MEAEKKVEFDLLNKEPKIFEIKNFLSDKYCNQLIECAKDNLVKSMVGTNENAKVSNVRTSSNTFVKIDKHKLIFKIFNKIVKLTGKNPKKFDKFFQVVKYKDGEEYKKHIDPSVSKIEEKNYCHRFFTILLYLSDVAEGGETYFPNIDLKVKPEKGKLVFFQNYKYDADKEKYVVDTKSYHSSLPVKNCEKWVANLWYHKK
jgi:prolyl 4-hydroxylase